MTHGQLTTDLAEIFDVLKAHLALSTSLSSDHIFLSTDPSEAPLDRPPADRFLVVRLGSFRPVATVIMGAGNNLVNFRGTLGVEAYARMFTDQDLRAYSQLTNASTGLLALWTKVLAALHQYEAPRPATPTQSLLTEPMTSAGFEFPRRKSPNGWGLVTAGWNISFLHRLS